MAARIVNPGSNVKWYAQASGVTVVGATKTYATYREMINDPNPSRLGWVTDASGDPTVDSGSALYAHNGSVWTKIYETEMMDAGSSNFVGWYPNIEDLQAQYPDPSQCSNGMYAILGDTDSIWVWDGDTETWKDTATMGNQIHWSQIIDPPTSHPISFISGLQDALDSKYTISVADQTFAKKSSLANVAFSGSYTDLIDVPDIDGLANRISAAENSIVVNGQRIDTINNNLVAINQDIAARLTIAVAESTYATKEYVNTALESYLTTETAANTYLTITNADLTYLTKTDAQNTYDTIASVNGKLEAYLTTEAAEVVYLTRDAALQLYATKVHTHDDLYMRTTAIQNDYYTKVQSDARFATKVHTHPDYALDATVLKRLDTATLNDGSIYIPYLDWASLDTNETVALKAGTAGLNPTCIEVDVGFNEGYWDSESGPIPFNEYSIPTINGLLRTICVSGNQGNLISIGIGGKTTDSGYNVVDGIGITGGSSAVPTAAAVREYVTSALAGFSDVFIYKGTVADTTALYAVENPKSGDVWHVTADQGEYVCINPTAATPADRWESLGGIFNASGLVEKINGTAHTVVKLAADGGIEASTYTTGGGALADPALNTTLATEAAVKAYSDGNLITAKNYTDGIANGKLDKVSGSTNDNIWLVGGTGTAVVDSGISINSGTTGVTIINGSATPIAPSNTMVPTEKAITTYVDSNIAAAGDIIKNMFLEAIGNIQLLIPSAETTSPLFIRLQFYNTSDMSGNAIDTLEYAPSTPAEAVPTLDFKIYDPTNGFITPPVSGSYASGIPRTYAGTFINIGTYDPVYDNGALTGTYNIDVLMRILNGVQYPAHRAYVKYTWFYMNGSTEVPVIMGAFMYPSFVVADPLSIGYYWQTATTTP